MRQATLVHFFLIGAVFFYASNGHALPSLAPKYRDKELRLSLLGSTYLTETPGSIADQQTGNLSLQLGGRAIYLQDGYNAALEGEVLFGLRKANYRYLNINELYSGYDNKAWSLYV